MFEHSSYYIYFASLVFACFYGIYRFKALDTPAKILAILVCCAFINESAAYYLAKKYHNNLPLYNLYSFIEFALLCLYFNTLVDVFTKKRIGIYIGTVGITFGIVNVTFIQQINSIDSFFLFFEALSVIGMSLFAFFRLLLKNDSLHLSRYPHFWFISIIIFFWSITFLYWGLFDYFNLKLQHTVWKIDFAILIVGAITYTAFGCVFLLYPKMTSSNE